MNQLMIGMFAKEIDLFFQVLVVICKANESFSFLSG